MAAGVRRIEVVTGEAAECLARSEARSLAKAAAVLNTSIADLPDRVAALLAERKKLEKELVEARRALVMADGPGDRPKIRNVNGLTFAPRTLSGALPKDLKPMADDLKKQIGSGVVALVTGHSGKASIVVGVTDDLTDRISAVDLVRVGSEVLGGRGGGGQPEMAQAGGPNTEAADAALAAIEEALKAA